MTDFVSPEGPAANEFEGLVTVLEDTPEPASFGLSPGEIVAKSAGGLLLNALESAPVRFIPTHLARSWVLARYTKLAFLIEPLLHPTNDPDVNEIAKQGQFSVPRYLSIPVLGARDSYWLGSGAYKVLKDANVPKTERQTRIAQSTGLLLPSHTADQKVKRHRSLITWATNRTAFYGKARVRSNHLELTDEGRVRFAEPYRTELLDEKHESPGRGCPAHFVRASMTQHSMVVDYWQRYTRKVFTPWGRKRSI